MNKWTSCLLSGPKQNVEHPNKYQVKGVTCYFHVKPRKCEESSLFLSSLDLSDHLGVTRKKIRSGLQKRLIALYSQWMSIQIHKFIFERSVQTSTAAFKYVENRLFDSLKYRILIFLVMNDMSLHQCLWDPSVHLKKTTCFSIFMRQMLLNKFNAWLTRMKWKEAIW